MAEKWEYKMALDEFISNSLIDLYTSIAGVSSGYVTILTDRLGYSPELAKKAYLDLDKTAQDRVSKAFTAYLKQKEVPPNECDDPGKPQDK